MIKQTKSNKVITDIETLKGLVAMPQSNIYRTLVAVIITNIALIITGITTIVSDHYTLKNVAVTTIENKENIQEVNKKISKIEISDNNQNYRITKLEDKK